MNLAIVEATPPRMKTPPIILSSPWLAVCLFSTLLLPLRLAAAPDKVEVLVDFTEIRQERDGANVQLIKNYDYAWGAWDKHITDIPKRGALIQAPINDGQLGQDNTDVKFTDTPVVELIFVVGNANKAAAINFYLDDSDGTEQQWNIPLTGIIPGKECHYPLDLTKCTTEQKPGKKPGLNLKKINTWRIQGDWSKSSLEILLVKLVAPRKE